MKNFLSFLILISLPSLVFSDGKDIKLLPEKYKKWLEEEVCYIITPKEKEVFLQLENDRERDIFIEAFWKARDPNPDTPENEFKEEHYRRISYANQYLGRLSPTPGWKTDRGRVYIILGEPNQIERYDNLPDVYPVEVWFYQGFGKYGLPNAFYVVFFRRDDSMDYELYSPVKDGPKSLLRFFEMYRGADPLDFEFAYRLLYQIKPELANKAVSLIPGEERTLRTPSLASEVLLSNISQFPFKRVKDEYAEKILKYKNFIEVDYTTNYIENSSLCAVLPDENGISFIHYLIEPKKLSVELLGGVYKTLIQIDGRISDLKGKTIYQFTRKIPMTLTEEDVNKLKSKPFSIQGLIPVVEGNYKLSLILKNTVSKEFTVVEKDINVPSFPHSISMTPPILGYGFKEEKSEGNKRAFRIERGRIFLSPFPNFSVSEELHVIFEIYGSLNELKKCKNLRFVFKDENDKVLKEKTVSLDINQRVFPFHDSFKLEEFGVGNFQLIIEVRDSEGNILLSERRDFGVSSIPYIPRPLVYSDPMPSADDPSHKFILASQYFNKGEVEKSYDLFREAYSKNPLNQKFAIGYAKALFLLKRFSEIKEVLNPFLNSEKREPDTLELLAMSYHAMGECKSAIELYKEFISHFGLKLSILNSIGECYLKIGDRDNALTAFEKSLEINPDQEEIRKIVSQLKRK
jgi:GWxTD domain-containing protein